MGMENDVHLCPDLYCYIYFDYIMDMRNFAERVIRICLCTDKPILWKGITNSLPEIFHRDSQLLLVCGLSQTNLKEKESQSCPRRKSQVYYVVIIHDDVITTNFFLPFGPFVTEIISFLVRLNKQLNSSRVSGDVRCTKP